MNNSNQTNKIEGIILDWAGTTVDFGCFAPVNAFISIFRDAGIDVTLDEARKPMGMLKKDHIRAMLAMPRINMLWVEKYDRCINENDVEHLYAAFEPLLMTALAEYSEPLPGVIETVEILRKMGLKIGSTTGYTDKMLEIVSKEASKRGYQPDFLITPDSTGSFGRPYPYMVFKNMEALKLSSVSKVIKVGDTIADIQEGINAGIQTVGVVIGSSQLGLGYSEYTGLPKTEKIKAIGKAKKDFHDAGADFVINEFDELPGLIDSLDS
jgi:phosphonoacetaldehyde hydrolase